MRLLVVADTHLRGGIGPLPRELHAAIGDCDAVVHAGDVTSAAALEELRAMARVYAVLGNNDLELAGELPELLEVELEGIRVAVVHDAGPAGSRAGRLARRFPAAHLVVFEHSHVPLLEEGPTGQLLVNPGSPTRRRSRSPRGFARLELGDGRVLRRHLQVLH
ncbi:MAG TPA: metallophosphoesterase family protein [Acidimicrobiales bacterium]|nr:metallophosphoesterase family protein [Acidimicrobiales bacterium]